MHSGLGRCAKAFLAPDPAPIDQTSLTRVCLLLQLTLVLPLRLGAPVCRKVTAGLDTVAVRMPAHPVARVLIDLAGVGVAAPSANISGRPSPTTAAHVYSDLAGRIAGLVDGGPAGGGIESTVVDCSGPVGQPIHVLRPGL
eukprot:SAG31_NODE_23234_length_508_cov_1.378973_2_plen_140_part_01